MKKVHEILEITEDGYQKIVFQYYFDWCHKHSNPRDPTDLQKLLANTALNLWFLSEYQKLEAVFLEECTIYDDVMQERDTILIYSQHILKIYQYSAPVLLKHARAIKSLEK